MLIIIQGINYVQNRKQNKWINWLSWWYWGLDKCRPSCYPRYSLLVQPFFFFLFLFLFSCFLAPSGLFFSLFFFLWCCDVRAYHAQKNCLLVLFYSNVPKWLQISLRSFSKKSAILSWKKSENAIFEVKKKKKRKYAHPSNKRSLLSFSERLLELSLHAKSSPYTVIYVDTVVLVIGNICYKKSFELFSRISKDWRYTEMLCFTRAFFFHEAYLRRIHAVTTKKWTERRDARAKLSFSLQKPIAFLSFSLPSRSADPLA